MKDKIDNKKCWQCAYSYYIGLSQGEEPIAACVYIIREGKKRPCPAGDECTVYKHMLKGDKYDLR